MWALLEVVDTALHEPWLQSLAAHLGATLDTADPSRQARRFASVRHIAELFDRYALQRPAMIRAWAAGKDVDATGAKLPPDARWQAELWRRLRARADQPDPAERIEAACARLREEPGLVELPGPAVGVRPHAAARRAAAGAARRSPPRRDVHLFLLHPSPGAVGAGRAGAADHPPRRGRHARAARQPAARLLGAGRARAAARHRPARRRATTTTRRRRPPARCSPRIQADVREDRPPPGPPLPGRADERLELGEDRSIQVHACHGRARQVEVLRDAILHLLAEDPTLEPRDVIVMCPDIETFAPLIGATFGAGRDLARRTTSSTTCPRSCARPTCASGSPTARCARPTRCSASSRRLLELADQRLTASQVLDLADREPVRRRFGLDDDDVARVEEWVAQSGIRWGLDAAHRAPFKLDKLPAGTWRAGLDRVLLGVAMTDEEQRLFGGVLPLDDVESGAIDLAGRFAELVDRLQATRRRACARPMTVGGWTRRDRRRGRRADRHARPRRAGSARSCSGCSTTSSREAAVAGAERPRSRSPRSARCSPSASRAARPAPTSAPAT